MDVPAGQELNRHYSERSGSSAFRLRIRRLRVRISPGALAHHAHEPSPRGEVLVDVTHGYRACAHCGSDPLDRAAPYGTRGEEPGLDLSLR
jgi:hypothetical protein